MLYPAGMLKHVSFLTVNANTTIEFYTRLGAHVEKDLTTHDGFRRLVLAFPDTGRLQFFQADGELPAPHHAWQEHIAVVVPDLSAVVGALRAAGVTFTRDVTLSPGGRSMAFVLDPDGRQVELLQAD